MSDLVSNILQVHHHANECIVIEVDSMNLRSRPNPAGIDSQLQSFDVYCRLEAVNVLGVELAKNLPLNQALSNH